MTFVIHVDFSVNLGGTELGNDFFYTFPDKNQNSKEEEELCTKGDKPNGILPPTNENTPTETNGNISLVRINVSLFHTPLQHLYLLIYFI